ncbi:MAG: lipoyl domain-containing protein [Gammaproteobacteria bacterium]|nr:lipoyl domain-containing protein [Gammaproteobacteria bacterium]MDH4256555.1 lipoyl domain-containing protein [Gammaproteobacteria bacterium]MDH5311184.1 lipoyl domain-containing protein [Gammaproteobacteria bacterium]
MKISLKLARVGMNMQEATIAKWHKEPGDRFTSGEELYDIETEKVTQAIEASGDGKLLQILVPAGEIAQVGQAVCVVEMAL